MKMLTILCSIALLMMLSSKGPLNMLGNSVRTSLRIFPSRLPSSPTFLGLCAFCCFASEGFNSMRQCRHYRLQAFLYRFGAARQVDNESFLASASHGAAQHSVRRFLEALRSHHLGEPRYDLVYNIERRLW